MRTCNPEHLSAFLSALDSQEATYEVDGQCVDIILPSWSATVVRVELSSAGRYLLAKWEDYNNDVQPVDEVCTLFDEGSIFDDVVYVYQNCWHP